MPLFVAALLLAFPIPDGAGVPEMQQAIDDLHRATVAKLRDDLRDPATARFRRVYLRATKGSDGNLHLGFCGEVNATNAFGGHTGWRILAVNRLDDGVSLVVGEERSIGAAEICDPSRGTWLYDTDFAPTIERDVRR